MYVLIVRDDVAETADDNRLTDIENAVREAAPDIYCEIISEADLDNRTYSKTAETAPERVRVRCFGEFEAFYGDKPLHFKRARTKELFALLICHRGSMLTMGTLMSILWEDGEDSMSDRSYLRNMISDLKRTLAEVGAEDIVIKKYNSLGIDTSKLDCDYYDFLKGDWDAVEQYNGQFMRQYPWADYELSQI